MYICFRNNRCVALHTNNYVQYVCISPTIVRCDKKLLCNCDTNYCHINYCALVAQFFFLITDRHIDIYSRKLIILEMHVCVRMSICA